MRRLFLELYHKQIFPSTPITSFSPFLSYIVVTPLMLGFEKDFSCHSHLGPIRIPPLFPFPPAPFPRNEKEDGTLELYYLSAYCLPKILLLQLGGHRVIKISRVFFGFPSSNKNGSEEGLILIYPENYRINSVLRFTFKALNNKAESETMMPVRVGKPSPRSLQSTLYSKQSDLHPASMAEEAANNASRSALRPSLTSRHHAERRYNGNS